MSEKLTDELAQIMRDEFVHGVLNERGERQFPTTVSLYTSDAADDMQCVDLGGRRIIKKKKSLKHHCTRLI